MTQTNALPLSIARSNISDYRKENDEQIFASRFSLLNNHKGFRPKKLHVLMGVAGGGKSTYVRSLINDFVKCNPFDVDVWLTEEERTEYLSEMSRIDEALIDRVSVHSELELPPVVDCLATAKFFLFEKIRSSQADLFVIDNITTSMFYRGTPNDQGNFINELKAEIKKTELPVVLIAHTGASITENFKGLIEMNHIRGCKDIVNLAEFFYILQSFNLSERVVSTIRMTKYRGQRPADKIFANSFDGLTRHYTGDYAIPWGKFNDIFANRNKLKERAKKGKYSDYNKF